MPYALVLPGSDPSYSDTGDDPAHFTHSPKHMLLKPVPRKIYTGWMLALGNMVYFAVWIL